MTDMFHRASIVEVRWMDPPRQLAGMTEGEAREGQKHNVGLFKILPV